MLHKSFLKQLKGGGECHLGAFVSSFLQNLWKKKAAGGERTGETKKLNIYITVVLIV